MKNIIAAIDFSNVTEKVIEKAAEIAASFPSKLWLIHVAAPDPEFVGYEIGPQHERDWRAETLHEEHKTIQDKAEHLRNRGIEVTALLVQGHAAETVLMHAEKVKADLIVLGTHGHGAIYKLLVGSVSEEILQKSLSPIMLIPSDRTE